MTKQPLKPETALKIIRTWEVLERDHPEVDLLVPAHVLKLCDEALGIDATPNTTEEEDHG